MNSFQWRTVAVLIREHLKLNRPVSTARAMKIAAKTRDPVLIHKINNVRFAAEREIPANSQFGMGA